MLKNYSNKLIKTINLFDAKLNKNFEHLKTNVIKSLQNGKKIIFFGNGGSASDAEHLATEFVVKFKNKINKNYNSIISVPSKETSRIQERHILIGHSLIAYVEKEL